MTRGLAAGAPARWRDRARADDGSTLPLLAGVVALALAISLVGSAAASLYLERKRLFTLADGAALAGAEAFDLSDVRVRGGRIEIRLEPRDVRRVVTAYLGSAATPGFGALRVDQATTVDGRSATVTLSSVWRPPLLTPFLPEGVRIDATATARTVAG